MSTIVTRAGKGSTLTWAEADANFTNLNTDKIQVSDITGATSKATLVDADVLPLVDSVGGLLNKGTWANIKTTLASTFAALAGSVSQVFSASSIELGHASDTTLTRVSAGVVAVEGSNILLASGLGSVTQAYDADTAKLDVDQSWTGSQRGTVTADNDLSFDLAVTNNFSCTPSAGGTLTFTNHTAGQSGMILLTNGSNYAIAAAATTKINATDLATISATGVWLLCYFDNGTNAYVTVSRDLT